MLIDSTRSRAATCAAVAALALGLAACGDSDDAGSADTAASGGVAATDSTGTAGKPPATSTPVGGGSDGPALAGDREQARAGADALGDVYDDLEAAAAAGVANFDVPATDTLETAGGDERLASVCALLSEQAKRQTVEYVKRSAGLADVDWTCERAVGLLLRRAAQAGQLKRSTRIKVIGVNAEGDRATATIRVGGSKGRVRTLSLVKEDGKWKLGTPPGGGQ